MNLSGTIPLIQTCSAAQPRCQSIDVFAEVAVPCYVVNIACLRPAVGAGTQSTRRVLFDLLQLRLLIGFFYHG